MANQFGNWTFWFSHRNHMKRQESRKQSATVVVFGELSMIMCECLFFFGGGGGGGGGLASHMAPFGSLSYWAARSKMVPWKKKTQVTGLKRTKFFRTLLCFLLGGQLHCGLKRRLLQQKLLVPCDEWAGFLPWCTFRCSSLPSRNSKNNKKATSIRILPNLALATPLSPFHHCLPEAQNPTLLSQNNQRQVLHDVGKTPENCNAFSFEKKKLMVFRKTLPSVTRSVRQ